MATLTASRLWLDSLRPQTNDANELTEIIALVNVEFVDENGVRAFVKQENIDTFAMSPPGDLAVIQSLFQTLVDGLKQQYGIT
jgi:hypothetical protein